MTYQRGRPLTDAERAHFSGIVADLSGDHRRVATAQRPPEARRLTQLSGWPAWLAAVLGLVLVLWGGLQDAGGPLLLGVVLVGTFPQWLRLPALARF